MLVIRMQRTGRSGHAQFRLIAQDKRFSPTSGRVVAYLGSYDPHAKTIALDKEKIEKYLANGAQPSDRLIKLFKKEGLKIPSWVTMAPPKKKEVRNPDKRRSTRPAGAPAPEPKAEAPAEIAAETTAAEGAELAEPTTEAKAPAPEVAEEPQPEPETPDKVPASVEEPAPAKEQPAEAEPEKPAE